MRILFLTDDEHDLLDATIEAYCESLESMISDAKVRLHETQADCDPLGRASIEEANYNKYVSDITGDLVLLAALQKKLS